VAATSSPKARSLLVRWPASAASFVKVFPREYQRVLAEQAAAAAGKVA